MLTFEKNYWNDRYKTGGNSGAGSYGKEVAAKIAMVVDIIKRDNTKSVLDLGCGDFNFGKTLLKQVDVLYTGLDISDEIVARNQEKYGSDKVKFMYPDFKNTKEKYDLVLCMDVLFHIINDADYEATLGFLANSYNKYLMISTIGKPEVVKKWAPHVKHRELDTDKLGKLIHMEELQPEEAQTTKKVFIFAKR